MTNYIMDIVNNILSIWTVMACSSKLRLDNVCLNGIPCKRVCQVGWSWSSYFRWFADVVAPSRRCRFGTLTGVRDAVFRGIPTVWHMANRFQVFSTVVAVNRDRKWSSRPVPGVSNGYNQSSHPQTVTLHWENTSATPETVVQNYLWLFFCHNGSGLNWLR